MYEVYVCIFEVPPTPRYGPFDFAFGCRNYNLDSLTDRRAPTQPFVREPLARPNVIIRLVYGLVTCSNYCMKGKFMAAAY